MVDIISVIVIFVVLLCIFLAIRFFALVPTTISFFIMRRQNFDNKIKIKLAGEYQIVELSVANSTTKGLFFPCSSRNEGSILIVPDWTRPDDIRKNMDTAFFLQGIGYDVFLPFFRDIDIETGMVKSFTFNTRKLYRIVEAAFHYLLLEKKRSRRAIGLYSNSMGTYLACFLVKEYAIRSVILEDGPVSLTNVLLKKNDLRNTVTSRILSTTLNLILYPFVWRTKWHHKRAIGLLRCTPTFLIASKEDSVYSPKNIWQNYNKLYKPKQIWFEHCILPKSLQYTWPKEYKTQISTFYSRFVREEIHPEYHFEFKAGRKQKGQFPVDIKISAMPPQLTDIPIQITLTNGTMVEELRLLFNGASLTVTKYLKFKPQMISLLHFYNVKKDNINPHKQWVKQQSEERVINNLDLVLDSPLEELTSLIDKYFYIKMVLFAEERKEAKLLKKQMLRISHNYIKSQLSIDPDVRDILSFTASY